MVDTFFLFFLFQPNCDAGRQSFLRQLDDSDNQQEAQRPEQMEGEWRDERIMVADLVDQEADDDCRAASCRVADGLHDLPLASVPC